MARCKFGSLVTDISGSIGGTTFQRSAFGHTIRNKPIPIKSRSDSQLSIRQFMKNAHQNWAALSSAERQQWQQFVSFSNQRIRRDRNVNISGHNLYIKYQVMRQVAGLEIKSSLEYISFPDWHYPSSIIQDAPSMYLSTLPASEDPIGDLFFIFKVSAPRPPAQQFNPRGLRYCTLFGETWDAFTFAESYVPIFGALPPLGSWLHYSYICASTKAPIFSNLRTGKLEVQPL